MNYRKEINNHIRKYWICRVKNANDKFKAIKSGNTNVEHVKLMQNTTLKAISDVNFQCNPKTNTSIGGMN